MKSPALLAVSATLVVMPAGAGAIGVANGRSVGRTSKPAPVTRCSVKGRFTVNSNSLVSAKNGRCVRNKQLLPVKWSWRVLQTTDDHGNRCSSHTAGDGRSFTLTPIGVYSAQVSFRVLPKRKAHGRIFSSWAKPQTLYSPNGWIAQCGRLPKQLPSPASLCPWSDDRFAPNCGVPLPNTCAWTGPPTYNKDTRVVTAGNIGCPEGGCSYWPYIPTLWFGYTVQQNHWLSCLDGIVLVGVNLIRLISSNPEIKSCQVSPVLLMVVSFTIPPSWGDADLQVAFELNQNDRSRMLDPYFESETGGPEAAPWHLTGSQDGCPDLLKLPHVPQING